MPFAPGERLDWIPIHTDRPDAAVFRLHDGDEAAAAVLLTLSLANGGLMQRRKLALHPVFNAPKRPGKYFYSFTDGQQVVTGHVRVQGVEVELRPASEPGRTMKYSGPGA